MLATGSGFLVELHDFCLINSNISEAHGIACEVVYFTMPHEDFPALCRMLRVKDLSGRSRHVEIIDGMPKLSPYGLNEWFMKHMSNTIEAWMEVSGVAERRPFYRLRVDAADVAETRYITSGHFYLSRIAASGRNRAGKPEIIVDPAIVFGASRDLVLPEAFRAAERLAIPSVQVDKNITPSAFSYAATTLAAGKSVTLFSLVGHADSAAHLAAIDRKMTPRVLS